MLGIYSGERDNDSAAPADSEGAVYRLSAAEFFVVAVTLAADVPSPLPTACRMAPALLPWCASPLVCSGLRDEVLSGTTTSPVMSAGRMPSSSAAFFGCRYKPVYRPDPWHEPLRFLVLSEVATLALWYFAVSLYHRQHPGGLGTC